MSWGCILDFASNIKFLRKLAACPTSAAVTLIHVQFTFPSQNSRSNKPTIYTVNNETNTRKMGKNGLLLTIKMTVPLLKDAITAAKASFSRHSASYGLLSQFPCYKLRVNQHTTSLDLSYLYLTRTLTRVQYCTTSNHACMHVAPPQKWAGQAGPTHITQVQVHILYVHVYI